MTRYYSGMICGYLWSGLDKDYFKEFLKDYFKAKVETEEKMLDSSYKDHLENQLLTYRFIEIDLESIITNVNKLENSVGKFMGSYKIIDNAIENVIENDNAIEYDYILDNDVDSREVAEQIAYLCLGRQIKYCLEKYKKCYFVI